MASKLTGSNFLVAATHRSGIADLEDCHEALSKRVAQAANDKKDKKLGEVTIHPRRSFTADFPVPASKVDSLIHDRANARPIHPELSAVSAVRKAEAYKRFGDLAKKNVYRSQVLQQLRRRWIDLYGSQKAGALEKQFMQLLSQLDQNGAVIFGELITKKAFEELIRHYNDVLKNQGSKSWIHSYINLANHPDFLGNPIFNGAFLHPLLIALISYQIGGAIRIVDARGKDAEPISVLAQDNMLHIDNTPFNDEYKIILTWEKDKPSGPKGQNFVFIPGTHKGARNCFVNKDGTAWSTENASIFITEKDIQQVFDFQKTVLPNSSPMVVEVHHRDKPLTTVFAAGSLVHHRYRTEEGFARSCMILAFHRAADNEGQFIGPTHLKHVSVNSGDLNRFLFGHHGKETEAHFIEALGAHAADLATLMGKLETGAEGAENLSPDKRKLSSKELEKWKAVSTHAPTVEQLKIGKNILSLGQQLSRSKLIKLVEKMMVFDKHGPLDLILYSDSHEEIRKWTRNQIREMRVDRLQARLQNWAFAIEQPSSEQVLSTGALQSIANDLAAIAFAELKLNHKARLDPSEKISDLDAFRSIRQLLLDLGEAITRCESRQTFLSTSLFLFWACDLLNRVITTPSVIVRKLGQKLLAHYISTAILIEKQIQEEQASKTLSLT